MEDADLSNEQLDWICVGKTSDLPEGRVKTVTARTTTICLSHFDGQWAAMDNRCPHQGGPLGEGTIERGRDTRITDASQLDGALREAIAHEGPALVEIITDAELV